MQKRLIKYLEENFNAKITHKTKFRVFLKSDLHLVDLPTVVKAFKGELQIDDDGDALVDKYDNLCLHIMYEDSPFNNSNPNRTAVTIFHRY